MHVAIFSQAHDDIALITRSLPTHDCRVLPPAQLSDLQHLAIQLLIIDIASAAEQLPSLLQMAHAQSIPVLLLATDTPADLATLVAHRQAHDGLFDCEFKPLQRRMLAARVKLLLRLSYPDHDDAVPQQFGDYLFVPATLSVTHAGQDNTLTRKEFALAILLFGNLGRPLSRTYLQESIWGEEEENALPTRTIDTHISRVRNKLSLTPAQGFRLSTVYGYGYQLERLAAPAAE